jgi:serine/threonine-protein kinase
MEYVDGHPLRDMLENGPLPANQAARLGHQIALGMATAHRQGIVHGDLKPGNLLVTRDGVVKITDFGLSRRAAAPQTRDDTTVWVSVEDGKIAGTPGYMSPEQSRGEPVTPNSDVFSLGAVLYEMVTGKQAFGGDNVLQVLDQIRNVDSYQFAEEVPDPFRTILREALVRDARNRGITMEVIAELLK